MRSIVIGKGGLHLNAKHSNEDSIGKGRGYSSTFCLYIIARPPPTTSSAGFL